MSRRCTLTLLLAFSLAALRSFTAAAAITVAPAVPTQWQTVTLDIPGSHSLDEQSSENPFLDHRVDVFFSHGDKRYIVPGYYAADGNAAETSATGGNIWRAHFVPQYSGTWTYGVSHAVAPRIAVDASYDNSGAMTIGSFEVAPAAPEAKGLLQYTGARYLKWSGNGKYFLKSGADSPENFLAYHEFDGAGHQPERHQSAGESAHAPLHRYEPHVRDWKEGDPTWGDGKGKGIIGGLNFLASRRVNSVYFLTMNVNGDGKDVWPWTDSAERWRFDCSKLDQWNMVFDHMDRLGIAMHVVLTETENESLFEFEEENDFALSRKLYYRELVARFAHHPALVWNIGEENGWDDRENKNAPDELWRIGNTDAQRQAFADYIRELDPYDHPIVVHTLPGRYDEIYAPMLGHESFDGVSLQVHLDEGIHEQTKRWIDRSAAAGRQWVANLDEIGPASDGVKPDADDPGHDAVRRFALWGNLMAGGGGCEWYFGYQYAHNDLGLEDYRSRENMWRQTAIAVAFFQEHLPFAEMRHADELVRGEGNWCFAKAGEVYAVYIPEGGTAEVLLPNGSFAVQWFDPEHGASLQSGLYRNVSGGDWTSIGVAPYGHAGDWVALLTRTED